MSDKDATDAHASPFENSGIVEYLQLGVLVVLVALAVVALFRFYTSASAAIAAWIAPAYEPAFQAAFNFVVLLACAAGVSVLARELHG